MTERERRSDTSRGTSPPRAARRGLTQTEPGKAAGILQRMVPYYELENAQPPVALLVDLACALKVSADELLRVQPVRDTLAPKARAYSRATRASRMTPPADQHAVLKLVDAMLDTRRRSTPPARAKRKAS
jgi:hypothetical protein